MGSECVEMTPLMTVRTTVWSGGSDSKLGARHGFSFLKSERPAPRLETKVSQFVKDAWTSS